MLIYLLLLSIILIAVIKIYFKLTSGWCRSQTCLVGKTVLVTGANTGIGYETALDFAKRGARVILACRNEKKAEEALAQIIRETDNRNVVINLIDMASFESVRDFTKNINKTENRLDILVNNAGIMEQYEKRTSDGHLVMMQVNHFSCFLLTHLLLDLMKKTGNGRIVNVSSLAGKYAIDFKAEDMDKFPGGFALYNHSKLCNILFTKELAQKLEGTGITTYSLHPGAVKTEILKGIHRGLRLIFSIGINLFFKTSEEGAQTTLHCALQKGIEDYSGEHFVECEKVTPYKTAEASGLSKKVWELTEKIVKLKPEERI